MNMILEKDVVSLTDFASQTRKHTAELKKHNRPRVLTHNGKATAVLFAREGARAGADAAACCGCVMVGGASMGPSRLSRCSRGAHAGGIAQPSAFLFASGRFVVRRCDRPGQILSRWHQNGRYRRRRGLAPGCA